ncbi:TRM11 family SAM-dependent methyltransferase [Actinokineospora terrae]|uniref:Methyltransferase domain-containing protein n=1 Tax=Actinokineospora terrae TaxID=155974 RepID=A0A1H9P0N8_9PSEU|nr:SAM-dependent methyltransferase [Actinokineospora terrae]SER41691.1 Methyltransferase domain-containing protein [Actinokineospora terrae]
MPTYALLVRPALNRVYADSSVDLMAAELAVFGDRALGGRIGGIEPVRIGGVPYLAFEADSLDERDVRYLANLSSAYALFERQGDLLAPVELTPLDKFDDDLVTIQKYSGKTNEHFTKLMLNLAVTSSEFAGEMLDRRLRVLDPLCGRGTTLNQALMYGYDTAGIDLDAKDFDAYSAFLQTWLKRKRIKHTADVTRVRRDGKVVARRLTASVGIDKESYKAGDALSLDYVNADTTEAPRFHRAATFDIIVADAPYGVQHGSRAGGGLHRGPLELMRAALPGWARLLRPGGTIALSWNTNVAPRTALVDALAEAELTPLDEGAYLGFSHRVDQAIVRDVVVARK